MGPWIKANGGPLALVVLGLTLAGVTTAFGWAFVALGLLWYLAQVVRGYVASKRERRESLAFPDVEFESHGVGFQVIEEQFRELRIPKRIHSLVNLRITNHEPERSVSLTFRYRKPLQAPDGVIDKWPLPPRTRMPIDVGPKASKALDIEYEDVMQHPEVKEAGPLELEVEDHLSGLRTPLPTMGRWRPAKDGEWTGAFPRPPSPIRVRIDDLNWQNFKNEARILEIHVAVTNQTGSMKEIESFLWRDGGSGWAASPDVLAELGKRAGRLPQLRRHAVIEPRATESGWVVRAFPYTPGGPPEFGFSVNVEGADYEAVR